MQSGEDVSTTAQKFLLQLSMGGLRPTVVQQLSVVRQLSVDWFDVPIGPQAVLQLLSCTCRRDCVAPACECVTNNLACTELCHLRQCKNQGACADEEPSNTSDSDDDSDNDEGIN